VCHPGNATFRDLLEAHQDESHREPSILDLHNTVSQIIHDVGRRQGRFLEWNNNCGCWVIMEDDGVIHKKVYQSLCYFKKTLYAKRNMQVNSSFTYLFERQDGKKRKREFDGSDPNGCAKACTSW
jgi:hypothetical protein